MKRSNKPLHFQRYRDISNRVRSLTRRDHTRHLEQITENLHKDQRPFWRWFKNTSGQHSQVPEVHHQGKVLSDPIQKAKALCKFFASVFVRKDLSSIGSLKEKLHKARSQAEVKDITITVDNVYDLLCKIDISKACGPDDIPGQLLKKEHKNLRSP